MYKLIFQNKNYIYKIKTQFFFYKKEKRKKKNERKPHRTREARVMRLV